MIEREGAWTERKEVGGTRKGEEGKRDNKACEGEVKGSRGGDEVE